MIALRTASILWVIISFSSSSTIAQPYHLGPRFYQDINIVSSSGARCEINRQGVRGLMLVMPIRDGSPVSMRTVKIDLTRNHEDIHVSCKKIGYLEKSTIAVFRGTDYIYDFAPCDRGDAVDRQRNSCEDRPLSASETVSQYPNTIRVILERSMK
jgi:hypothetical protein